VSSRGIGLYVFKVDIALRSSLIVEIHAVDSLRQLRAAGLVDAASVAP